ncbi:hypothetical protein [Pseudomonas sp. GW456-12-1-14-TSB6]|uniref:hypothetical protein n=1 Tax=Pseudomonas sp. GW456-12-1-14-TSB6 TaxID=2751350 RepID=UPI000CD32808|nr:hypothetical protein [Pseudomonas sp. GW456-12-1-14-TSB6]POA39131.1 hypothetical protein C1891_06765 [Pseudomonas sp. GW456-12-1-14-TSB6]
MITSHKNTKEKMDQTRETSKSTGTFHLKVDNKEYNVDTVEYDNNPEMHMIRAGNSDGTVKVDIDFLSGYGTELIELGEGWGRNTGRALVTIAGVEYKSISGQMIIKFDHSVQATGAMSFNAADGKVVLGLFDIKHG